MICNKKWEAKTYQLTKYTLARQEKISFEYFLLSERTKKSEKVFFIKKILILISQSQLRQGFYIVPVCQFGEVPLGGRASWGTLTCRITWVRFLLYIYYIFPIYHFFFVWKCQKMALKPHFGQESFTYSNSLKYISELFFRLEKCMIIDLKGRFWCFLFNLVLAEAWL